MDQVASNTGVSVGSGERIGCTNPNTVLVFENGQASCVPRETTCARDERWNGKACIKTPQCVPGWILNSETNTCVPINTNETDYTTDLQAWTYATYGAFGGNGSPAFCSGFAKKPRTFGVGPGGSIRVIATVHVSAANRVVTNAAVTTNGIVEASRAAVTPQGALEIQRTATELLASLRVQGGKSKTASAQTQVKCLIVNSEQPASIPESGGL